MSTDIKSVVVAGGSGNLGKPIVNELLKTNLKVSVLTRADSTKPFPGGVNVIKTDYSADSLKGILKGQDAIISVLGFGGLKDQPALVDAAADSGVKWFFPSEFGHDTASEIVRSFVPALAGKRKVVEQLIDKENTGLSWTAVVNGLFFDWVMQGTFISFNLKTKTAPLFDGGNVPFSVTNTTTIAKALAALLTNPTLLAEAKNKYIYLASHTTTQLEVLAALEKASGEKWKREDIQSGAFIQESKDKLARGDFSGISGLIRALAFSKVDGVANSDYTRLGVWNEKLGLPKEDFEADVKDVLAKI